MSTVLGYKEFLITNLSGLPIEEIEKWFESLEISGKCLLELKITNKSSTRNKGNDASIKLNRLVDDDAIFLEEDYHFDFNNKRYMWDNEDIYLTANEALFLYRLLILKEDVLKSQKYYLYNMRRRLGNDFLPDDLLKRKNEDEDD